MAKLMARTLGLAAALVLVPAAAFAQPPGKPAHRPGDKTTGKAPAEDKNDPAVAEAREHFNRAQSLYDEGHPDAALIELQRAYAVKPNYRLLFNIGELTFTNHDYVGSYKAFERFLKEGGTEIEPAKRAEAESRLITLKVLVGSASVRVDADGAAVSLDDEPIGTSPIAEPVLLSAGRHRASATKAGYVPVNLVFTVVGGEKNDVALHLAPIEPPRPVTVAVERPAPSRFTTWSWVGIGAAGALATGAVVTGILSAKASSDLDGITFAGATPSQAFEDKQSAMNRDRVLAITLGGAAVAVLATTLVLTFRHHPTKGREMAALKVGLGPGGMTLSGGFQ